VLSAGSSNSVRRALILVAITGRFSRRKNAGRIERHTTKLTKKLWRKTKFEKPTTKPTKRLTRKLSLTDKSSSKITKRLEGPVGPFSFFIADPDHPAIWYTDVSLRKANPELFACEAA